METATKTYLTCAETAKLLRKQLKQHFPGVKFSVRSDTYSGGASIDVSWTDGPTSAAVDEVCEPFRGADFDGMIDLKSYNEHWLEPDGSARLAHAQGTEGSRGYHPEVTNDPTSANSRLVSFGADFVFCHRNRSTEWTDEVLGEFERITGYELPRDPMEWHRTTVPLSVSHDGTLHHMVETEQNDLAQVLLQYTTTRSPKES